jgi:hypothetical protein
MRMRRVLQSSLVVTVIASATGPVDAQGISGTASSAQHCLAGNGANGHPVGWIESGSRYSVTFDAGVALATVLDRIDLVAEQAFLSRGTPDINGTASTAGMAVLRVAGNGQAGCYRYRITVTPPAAQTAGDHAREPASEVVVPAVRAHSTQPASAAAITGAATSGEHCVAGSGIPQVHELGRMDTETQLSVSFDADFDGVAGATFVNMESSGGTWLKDAAPLGFTTTARAGTHVLLYVAGSNGAIGCYRYKVEIR